MKNAISWYFTLFDTILPYLVLFYGILVARKRHFTLFWQLEYIILRYYIVAPFCLIEAPRVGHVMICDIHMRF